MPERVEPHRLVDERGEERLRIASLEQREPRLVEPPRRGRVEDAAAADGRLAAQHEPVAARGDERPRRAGAGRTARRCARRGAGTAEVPWQTVTRAAASGARRPLEHDVEPVARRVRARRDERVAARRAGARRSADDRERDALPGLGALDRLAVHLRRCARERRTPPAAPRAGRRRRSRPTRAFRSRPCPAPGEAERRGRRTAAPRRRRRRRATARGRARERRDAARRARRRSTALTGTTSVPGSSSRTAAAVASTRSGVGRVDLGDARRRRARSPSSRRICRCSSVCGFGPSRRVDDEQEEVDPGRAGDHRPHEALVARHVDHREPRAVRRARAARSRARSRSRVACSSGSRSVSVPVSASTSRVLPWSMWPAVPSVSRACAHAAGCDRRGDARRPRRRRSCGSRAASARRGRRATTGARRSAQRPLRARRRARRRRSAARAAAARRRRRGRSSRRPRRRRSPASRSARARTRVERLAQHPQHRHLRGAPARDRGTAAASPRARRA